MAPWQYKICREWFNGNQTKWNRQKAHQRRRSRNSWSWSRSLSWSVGTMCLTRWLSFIGEIIRPHIWNEQRQYGHDENELERWSRDDNRGSKVIEKWLIRSLMLRDLILHVIFWLKLFLPANSLPHGRQGTKVVFIITITIKSFTTGKQLLYQQIKHNSHTFCPFDNTSLRLMPVFRLVAGLSIFPDISRIIIFLLLMSLGYQRLPKSCPNYLIILYSLFLEVISRTKISPRSYAMIFFIPLKRGF